MQSDVNFPLVLCQPSSQIIQPKFNQCKRFVLHPHFPFIYLTVSILGSSTIFGLSFKYTLRFVPSKKLNRDLAAGKISKEEADRKLSLINADFLDTTVGSIFDGSVIKNMAESAAEICSIASSLYMGYLDAATRIAQSSGGGGGPGTGWGKRDDENDLDFRRRCFGMAMKMMKPGRQQRLKR